MSTNYPLGSNNPKAPWNKGTPIDGTTMQHEDTELGLRFEYTELNNCEPSISNIELWNDQTKSWMKATTLPSFVWCSIYEKCLKIVS